MGNCDWILCSKRESRCEVGVMAMLEGYILAMSLRRKEKTNKYAVLRKNNLTSYGEY